jgi:hypothetical protein
MTKHKNVALDELRILAALMVLGVHTGQKVGLGDAAAVGAQGVQLFFAQRVPGRGQPEPPPGAAAVLPAPHPADPAAVLAGAGAALAV